VPDKCFIPYCEEEVVRQGVKFWLSDSPVFERAAYCRVHVYGCGMGVGVPMQKRPAAFKSAAKGVDDDV
jgi:hypothetical protein